MKQKGLGKRGNFSRAETMGRGCERRTNALSRKTGYMHPILIGVRSILLGGKKVQDRFAETDQRRGQ